MLQLLRSYVRWWNRWLLLIPFFLLFFAGLRFFALHYYGGGPDRLGPAAADLGRAFFTGARFDLVAACYALILPLLMSLFWSFFPYRIIGNILVWFERSYFVVVVVSFVIIAIGDFGYYSYFQDHLNVLVFGLFDDDTEALIRTFQKNYPFYPILIGTALAVAGMGWLSTKIFTTKNYPLNKQFIHWQMLPVYLVLIPLLGLGARGSVGLFPLHEIDAAVSPNSFVNYLAYNGIHGLHRSFQVRGENTSVWNTNGIFYGYGSWRDAAIDLFGKKREELPSDPLQLIEKKSPKNSWAEKKKPHVVMLLIEGWGGYWMKYDSPEFNLLGELKPHFQQDQVLFNFFPSMTATIGSLSAMMVNSPHRPDGSFLTDGRYMQVPFRFAPAPIFKKAGYKTRFIYAGGIGWRAVDRYAKVQGFDTIEGDFSIEEKFGHKIEKHDWGIFDGDVYRYIYETLLEAKEPQFILLMTTSNHPPYQVPTGYQQLPLNIPPDLQSLLVSDAKLSFERFRVFQYANRSLGELMDRIKGSRLADHTIVAASGDHGFLLRNFDDSELLQKWQTPFYLYVPPEGRQNLDPETFGSHIDVYPTLFGRALSEATHYSFGVDLFDAKAKHEAFHFSRLATSPYGAILAFNPPLYFDWETKFTKLKPTTEPSEELQNLNRKYRGMMGMLDYLYEYELEHSKKK